MRRLFLYTFSIWVVLICTAGAEQIRIKRDWNLLIGWKYSINGQQYRTLSASGMNLYSAMAGNEAARREMQSYGPNRLAGHIFAGFGACIAATPFIISIINSKSKNDYWTCAISGAAMLGVGTIFIALADYHLKKAVRIYNGWESPQIGIRLTPHLTSAGRNLNASLVLIF
jgi:hypothetical protein